MPKLTIDQRTKGKAVKALLELYKKEPDFVRELEQLRAPYAPVLTKWLGIGVPAWINVKKMDCEGIVSRSRLSFCSKQDDIQQAGQETETTAFHP